MNRNDKKKHRRSKRKLKKRLQHIQGYERENPMMTATIVHYEIGAKAQVTASGGIGAMHMLAVKTGLRKASD